MLKNILVVLMLMLISFSVLAVEISPVTDSEVGTDKLNAIQQNQTQLIQRMAQLESRFNDVPVKSDLEKQLNSLATFTNQKVNDSTGFLLIALVLSQLFQLGLAGGLYIYFKMNRRL